MVKKENPVYLFIGQDSLSKDTKLKSIKQEYLSKEVEQFNLDILYARELSLRTLEERFLAFPVRAKKRVIVVKDAQALEEDIKAFLLKYVRAPSSFIVLVLDFSHYDPKDEFINRLAKYSVVCRFREQVLPDTFVLARQINLKKADYALRILSQLLDNGQKPEWILGGLRYATERDVVQPLEKRRRLNLLLHCDIDIKTGRLKPVFALERLVVGLCGSGFKPLG